MPFLAFVGQLVLFVAVFASPLIVLGRLGRLHARSQKRSSAAARADAAMVAARFKRIQAAQEAAYFQHKAA